MSKPNFLHLGPGKAGSTWLLEVLPGALRSITEAKDLYFFSRYYDRGGRYEGQFADANGSPVIGEMCPDYLAAPEAAARIGLPRRGRQALGEPA